jgi:hypothetical protein
MPAKSSFRRGRGWRIYSQIVTGTPMMRRGANSPQFRSASACYLGGTVQSL